MYPIALEIGSLTIRWYGVMAAIGFIAASCLLDHNRKFANLSKDQCGTLLIIALIAGIAGARIFYVAQFFYESGFADDPLSILYIHRGGLVFYGGFILALICIVIYSLKNHLDIFRVLDVFTPAITAAHGFGRIGCFLNGCCFGRPTDAFWGVTAPEGSYLWMQTGGVPIHPIQLLEAGENFILCIFFCLILKKGAKRGTVVSAYLAIYGILRCFNETLRGDNDLFWKFTPAQWIGIFMILIGSSMFYYFRNHEKKS